MKNLKKKSSKGYKRNIKKDKAIAKYRRYLAKEAAKEGITISKLVGK